ncbi:MAG: hypothetical protein Q7U75_05150 [Desulfobacterales bacterium]|nr:hypothetical protein [Desulfobacterales bacterium]
MPKMKDGENAEPINESVMRTMLSEIGNRLTAPVEIASTGGGVVLLAYRYEGTTDDLDSILRSSVDAGKEFWGLVDEVAAERGIGPRWLNESVSNIIPAEKILAAVDRREKFGAWLTVGYVSDGFLLASKCQAARPKDRPQVVFLLKQLGHAEQSEVLAITFRHFPEMAVGADRELIESFVEECFWELQGW